MNLTSESAALFAIFFVGALVALAVVLAGGVFA
jgi:hypothetical protein